MIFESRLEKEIELYGDNIIYAISFNIKKDQIDIVILNFW